MKQLELFEKDPTTGTFRKVTVENGNSGRLPLAVIYLSLAFLLSTVAFLGYMLWDFGIAGRVILFLVLILVIVHAAIFIAKQLIDSFHRR